MTTFSALLLTLGSNPAGVRARLAGSPDMDVGELQGPRLPVVLESKDPQEAAKRIEALWADPGILGVDLVITNDVQVH